MAHSIKTVYVVHHSHTDIGYTDLQERVIAIQVNYIKTVLSMMRQPEYADFRWNCETLYCVEEFWKQASEEDRADFARFVKEGKIGISANYLNFNDLVNADVFGKRLAKWQDKLQPFGTKIHTAMAADVNGFSMGYRDAMIENGVEFFFTNVHCHHGMYPLYQNQNAFFWENASGQRLLVWNGEHYNLGNVLGLQPNHAVNWMMRNRLGEDADAGTSFSDQLHTNLDKYLTECETEGYPYDFIDLVNADVFGKRLAKWQDKLQPFGTKIHTAMAADVNGFSMGYRDAMIENGVEFFFTNVHCHHGMYPLYQNQNAFFWENASGQRLLVWNGEHYNLGNVLGLQPNHAVNWMMRNRLGEDADAGTSFSDQLHTNLDKYLTECETEGYPYDFIVTAVSGVFSDNAPPSAEIMETIRAYNEKYGQEVRVEMVSLQELYAAIAPKLTDAPVYRGGWTDWWANGVGSTPYAVKHYKDADHRWQLANRLDPDAEAHYPALAETVQDNLMLYAEHTWGHSSTITNPYDTMVLNLDMRKNSYASKAHEAASLMLCSIAEKKGDMLRYYNTTGAVRAVGVSHTSQPQLIEFYIETLALEDVEVRDLAGNLYTCQVSPHPRGRKISFIDTLSYGEEKEYIYTARHKAPETLNTRHCYMGAEEVRDIVNDYDPVTYRLPYEVENKFFRICYKPGDGITSFVDKRTGTEMAGTAIPFFTPIYQRTPLHQEVPFSSYEERRALGRNIRGKHAETHIGKLMEITCMEHGPVFTQLRLHYSLAGTVKADVLLKLYEAIPRIDFTLELGKTISDEVESVFLSLDLNRPGNGTVLRKGAREAFRPGIDQLPGTCMEFYMSDDGAARLSPEGGVLIAARDVPMFYTGEMQHHPIRLCDGAAENNARPLYSWVMNNNWETNFKMDLSGFCQYYYSLWLTDISDPEQAMDELHEQLFDPYVLIVR